MSINPKPAVTALDIDRAVLKARIRSKGARAVAAGAVAGSASIAPAAHRLNSIERMIEPTIAFSRAEAEGMP